MNTQNQLCEGAVSNLFWVQGGTLYTPAVESGLLQGIVRDKVLTLAVRLNMTVMTGLYGLKDLLSAEEVFVTNSIMGVMPVTRVNSKQYSFGNELTKRIMDGYHQLIEDEINK